MLKRSIILLAIISVCLFGQGALAQPADPSFECLTVPGPLEVISGFYNEKFKPDVAPGKRFDARGASFEIPGIISHSLVSLEGSGDNDSMCWAGGYFTASLIWHGLDVSWDQSKHGTDGDDGVMNNTTSATSYEDRMTWTGLHVFNLHDGIRTNNSESNWTIQHTWMDYIRDDCVENDHIYSGTIYDSLFDGCYTGVSVRPSSSGHGDGQGKTITMDRVLLRMEPMPYPYKWDTKDDPVLYVDGYGDVPFGYGKVFKLDEGNEPDFRVTNCVFLLEYDAGKTIFPTNDKVSACSNNTVIWLGDPDDAPNYLLDDFPGCFTVITDRDQGKSLWEDRVADWHARHPGVGASRKPAVPGDYSWPRYAPEGSMPPPNVEPDAPVLLLPDNAETDVLLTPQLQTNDFSDTDGHDHGFTQWQIGRRIGNPEPCSEESFTNSDYIVFDGTSDSQLTLFNVRDFLLDADTGYCWRARFTDTGNATSDWSALFAFKTIATDENDQNQNGIPDDQEVDDPTLDLDDNGVPDVNQGDMKCVNTDGGARQIGVKEGNNVASIECLNWTDPNTIDDTQNKPDDIPMGLVSFKLEVDNPGDIAEVTVYLSEPAPAGAKWYKYYAINGWQDYSAHAVFSPDRTSVELEFKDGGFGDADGVENSIIIDPSGAGMLSSGSGGGGGGGGCLISTAAYGLRMPKESLALVFLAGLLMISLSVFRKNFKK